jgi:hypothetical protein
MIVIPPLPFLLLMFDERSGARCSGISPTPLNSRSYYPLQQRSKKSTIEITLHNATSPDAKFLTLHHYQVGRRDGSNSTICNQSTKPVVAVKGLISTDHGSQRSLGEITSPCSGIKFRKHPQAAISPVDWPSWPRFLCPQPGLKLSSYPHSSNTLSL